jgi:hypothetical protein
MEVIDGWVRLDDFCEKYQQVKGTCLKRVHDGGWQRGVIYSSPTGGEGWVHEERAVAWLKKRKKLPQTSSTPVE